MVILTMKFEGHCATAVWL